MAKTKQTTRSKQTGKSKVPRQVPAQGIRRVNLFLQEAIWAKAKVEAVNRRTTLTGLIHEALANELKAGRK